MKTQTKQILQQCMVCPRQCGVNRIKGKLGFCQSSILPKVALVSRHEWEEPPISGTRGSGTVFFSHCNMKCVFCQNHDISQHCFGEEISIERLTEIFLEQQQRNVHNINLVSAVQYLPQVAEALQKAKQKGLHIPVVYNSNGYESVSGLRLLDGLIDVYLPDFKYWSEDLSIRYSQAPRYATIASDAIQEMKRQIPQNHFDEEGIMKKGVIVRHLVLPNHYKDSFQVLDWIREYLGTETYVSLLRQYTPMYQAKEIKTLSRTVTTFEYEKVTSYFLKIGLKHGFVQQRTSATQAYTPCFDGAGVKEASSFRNI